MCSRGRLHYCGDSTQPSHPTLPPLFPSPVSSSSELKVSPDLLERIRPDTDQSFLENYYDDDDDDVDGDGGRRRALDEDGGTFSLMIPLSSGSSALASDDNSRAEAVKADW